MNSAIPVILGGVHPSLMPDDTLQNEFVDYVVIGDGEETFVELLKNLGNPEAIKKMKGIGYREKGKIIVNQPCGFANLNKSPIPNYGLINVNDYIINGLFPIFTSRGCPHRCGFCYNVAFNFRKHRAIEPKSVLPHIEYLVKNPEISTIQLLDDNFFADFDRATEICGLIIEKNISIKLTSGCRANYLYRFSMDYLKLLKRAGFVEIYIGVESGSAKILNDIKKDITVEQVIEVNKKLREVGITARFGFMAGFPTETIEDVKLTIKLINRLLEDNPSAYITQLMMVTLYPGMELFEVAKQYGFKPPEKMEDWVKFDYEAWESKLYPWLQDDSKKFEFVKEMAYVATWLDAKSFKNFLGGRERLEKIANKLLGNLFRIFIRLNLYGLAAGLSRLIKFVGRQKQLVSPLIKKVPYNK
ncbi:MAG: B12-binding domain-containing radical SAM protein [Elusimicrobia bacterium]|nr:B12-binding domain-containing radical SAM protein [Elusimicrobiota bacterium]